MIQLLQQIKKELGKEIYTDLILFHQTHKNEIEQLKEYISKIILESEFETWKLTELLEKFINEPKKIKEYLDTFYDLYCGTFDADKGGFHMGYVFLEHLGLNYFWWMDESYLRYYFKRKWKTEYLKRLNNFENYHKQLRPIAEKILTRIDPAILKTFTQDQLTAIRNSICQNLPPKKKHSLDVHGTIPLFFRRMYFVSNCGVNLPSSRHDHQV